MRRTFLSGIAILTLFFSPSSAHSKLEGYKGKKVLVINSYHKGYGWSDDIYAGIEGVLKNTDVKYEIAYMDSKNQGTEEYKLAKALELKKRIETEKPDVVITSDDNAVKYILKPYFKDSNVPFVHTGINWDGTKYGMPYKNATGMFEVALVKPMLQLLFKYAKGKRVGSLAADNESEHSDAETYNSPKYLNGTAMVRFVKTFAEFKHQFLEMQKNVDVVIMGSLGGVVGFTDEEAAKFIAANSKIPVGTVFLGSAEFSMVGLMKIGNEAGEWAARSALKIMDGTKPSDIPEVDNKEAWLVLNPGLAGKVGITFPPALLNIAAATITDVHKSFQLKDSAEVPHYKYQK